MVSVGKREAQAGGAPAWCREHVLLLHNEVAVKESDYWPA